MSLSCGCSGDYDWFYDQPDDFSTLETSKRKRCISCNELIDIKAPCVQFHCWRPARTEIEERFKGYEVYMAPKYMCEKCGEIFLNLSEYGYCVTLGGNMKDDLETHWALTNFDPLKYAKNEQVSS